MRRRRQLALVLVGALILALTASVLLTHAWVSENLGGDFKDLDTGQLRVGAVATLFLMTSAALAVPLTIVAALAAIAMRLIERRKVS